MKLHWFAIGLALLGCQPEDESLTAFVGDTTRFQLVRINGEIFAADATIDLSEPGQISGDGPCNSFSASQSVPYPWINVGPIIATKRACSALSEEAAFYESLRRMTIAEISGSILVLSNEDADEMEFQAVP